MPVTALGHQYTPERGRFWLLVVISLGVLLNLSMAAMLFGWVPALLFLAFFVLFCVGAVIAVLDFVIPTLQEKPRVDPGLAQEVGLTADARLELAVRIEQCLIDAHGRAIQPRTIADNIGAALPDVEITLIGLHEEDRVEPYGWSGCWKLPEPPKEMA
jgi:hypothetical protein